MTTIDSGYHCPGGHRKVQMPCVSLRAPTNSETGDESGAQAGHFVVLQPRQLSTEQIRRQLHDKIIGGNATVHPGTGKKHHLTIMQCASVEQKRWGRRNSCSTQSDSNHILLCRQTIQGCHDDNSYKARL